jgi:hypothetical protein
MGALKSAMFDIGYTAEEIGITETAQKYHMSEEDVKMCIMFVNSFDGSWEEFEQHAGSWQPTIH